MELNQKLVNLAMVLRWLNQMPGGDCLLTARGELVEL
jgi:hypothetical protein